MGKYESIKTEIKELGTNLKLSENKIYDRLREMEGEASNNASDLRLISSNMTQVADKVGELVLAFEKHDENEMKEYTSIREEQAKVDNELKTQKVQIKEIKETQDGMKKNQDKFFKYIYIGSGIILAFTIIGVLLNLAIDFKEVKKSYSEKDKSIYYDNRIKKSRTILELMDQIDELKKQRG